MFLLSPTHSCITITSFHSFLWNSPFFSLLSLLFAQFRHHRYLLTKLIKYLSKFGQFENFGASTKQSTVNRVDLFWEPFLKSVTLFATVEKLLLADTPALRSFCWQSTAIYIIPVRLLLAFSTTTHFHRNCTMKRRMLWHRRLNDLFVLSKKCFLNFCFIFCVPLSDGGVLLKRLVWYLVGTSTCVDQLITAFPPNTKEGLLPKLPWIW